MLNRVNPPVHIVEFLFPIRWEFLPHTCNIPNGKLCSSLQSVIKLLIQLRHVVIWSHTAKEILIQLNHLPKYNASGYSFLFSPTILQILQQVRVSSVCLRYWFLTARPKMDQFPSHCLHPIGTIKFKQLGQLPGHPLFVVGNYFLRDFGVCLVGCTTLLVKGVASGCVLPNLQRNICACVTLHELPRIKNMCTCNFMTHPHPLLGEFFQNVHRRIDGYIWGPSFLYLLSPDPLLDLIHPFLHGALVHNTNLLPELPPEILPPTAIGKTLWKIPIDVSSYEHSDCLFRIPVLRNSTLKNICFLRWGFYWCATFVKAS